MALSKTRFEFSTGANQGTLSSIYEATGFGVRREFSHENRQCATHIVDQRKGAGHFICINGAL